VTKLAILPILLIALFPGASAGGVKPDIDARISAFQRQLGAVDAAAADRAWSALGATGSEEGLSALRKDLKRFGPLKKMTLLSRHDGVAERFIRLAYKLSFKAGGQAEIEITFIRRIDATYEVYDASLR
jgi:hypothetical protein